MRASQMIKILAVLIASALQACALVPTAEQEEKQARFQQTVPTCKDEHDCKAKWEAAQLWIVHNAKYKIQTATDVLLETYNSTDQDPGLAVQVTKEPQGGGAYQILVKTWCANMFGCNPDALDAAIDFNLKVGAASP